MAAGCYGGQSVHGSVWGDGRRIALAGWGRLALSGLLLVLAACGSGNGTVAGPGRGTANADSRQVQSIRVPTVDGREVSALLGHVPGTRPTRLVVFCHGATHTVEEAWQPVVAATVRPDTAVIASNYRGDELLSPEFTPFPILAGAQDTIAATQLALARFPSVETVYLLGVSLGGAVSGIAIAESTRLTPDGSSLYDYWIAAEGVANLAEYWVPVSVFAQANPLAAALLRGVEADPGGTPAEVPQEYLRRSSALRAQEMQAGGLRAAALVHASNDGIVPYDMSRQMAAALRAAGVPTHLFTVLRDSDGQVSGTGDRFADYGVDGTLTGLFTGALGLDNPNDSLGLNLTGHGDELDYAHPVVRTSLELLRAMLDGSYVVEPYAETVVDDQGGLP